MNSILNNPFVRYGIFIVIGYTCLIAYIDYSHLWVNKVGSGLSLFNDLIFFVELPFALLVSSLLFFPSIKNSVVRYLLPIIPILVLYALVDGFFNYMGRSPHFSDFQNLGIVFEFSFSLALSIILFALLIPLLVLVIFYHAKKASSKKTFLVSSSSRAFIFVLILVLISSESFNHLHEKVFEYTVWAEEDTLRENGKFSTFIYYSNQERINYKRLMQLSSNDVAIHQRLYPGELQSSRNIHMIVLESFIDPRLIEELQFERSILSANLLPYLNKNGDFSHIISPIYGGGTAQAEFELLTGLKALSKVNQIEFNVMKGKPVSSFAQRLEESHYRSVATIGPSSTYFNSRLAYQSLGFTNIDYLEDISEAQGLPDTGPLFDGDLLEQNLDKVRKTMEETSGPIFNYVLGMYGHFPFRRDEEKRPDIVSVEHDDDRLRRVSNQFYYRTQALGQYLKELSEIDKDSIIVVISDHLPSIFGENITYKHNNKVNIALLIDRGETIDISGKNFYEIPWFIWDLMSLQPQNRNIQEKEMQQLYYKALSESL